MKTITAILLLSMFAFGQTTRTPTVTRTVQMFGDLERKLESAQPAAKSQFLADTFEERLCAEPGTPVPLHDWLQKSITSQATFTQEAVHMYDDIAVYSALHNSSMIVDIWQKTAAGWQLTVRYRCPAAGSKPTGNVLPKRY